MEMYIIIILAIYFIPTMIAYGREHHNTAAIFAVNLLLGWSIFGWIGALVWACTAVRKQEAQEV